MRFIHSVFVFHFCRCERLSDRMIVGRALCALLTSIHGGLRAYRVNDSATTFTSANTRIVIRLLLREEVSRRRAERWLDSRQSTGVYSAHTHTLTDAVDSHES